MIRYFHIFSFLFFSFLITSSSFPQELRSQLPSLHAPKKAHLAEFKTALTILQEGFFDFPTGTYPTGIDWTRAVLGTHLAAGIHTMSGIPGERALSNTYFAQLIAFFYGQDDEGLRRQAFDDILWVVLGWLEALKAIDYRKETFKDSEWTGAEWRNAFARRALEFYILAEGGWDTTRCAGGMLWSPYLDPYKNAITNELYISASIAMYLYYGDRNERYLFNAVRGHEWLRNSNMTNKQGLYTDGFHISNDKGVGEKICDVRNEMVYTYNQGVLLSGLRGLAEATGDEGYLTEGFQLVDAVVTSEGRVGEIVRDGILTEKCDIGGYCSQDGHTFKGRLGYSTDTRNLLSSVISMFCFTCLRLMCIHA